MWNDRSRAGSLRLQGSPGGRSPTRLAGAASSPLSPRPVLSRVPSALSLPEADDDGGLPEGWEQRVSRRTGITFWHHTGTGETTLKLPSSVRVPQLQPSSPPLSPLSPRASVRPPRSSPPPALLRSGSFVQLSPIASSRQVQAQSPTRRQGTEVPVAGVHSPQTAGGGEPSTLPPGWEERVSRRTGTAFFYHPDTGVTTRRRPDAATATSSSSAMSSLSATSSSSGGGLPQTALSLLGVLGGGT